MRKLLSILLCCSCFLLSGCAVEADRIYTVCCIDNGIQYVYDGSGNFYTVGTDGSLTPNINPKLIRRPALTFMPKEGEYDLKYVLPGYYRGTLTSLEHYVYAVCSDLTSIEVIYSDPNSLELIVPAEDISLRILFNIRGDVRIYSSDGTIPLYLDSK